MMEIEPIYVNNLAYIKAKISDETLRQIKDEAEFILKNQNKFKKYNKKLAGNLEKEYSIDKSQKILKPYLFTLANEFHKHLNENENYPNWVITDMWINFQKKYEYNPLHNHVGDLSFVLWVQIPYSLDEEMSLVNCKNSNTPSNSLFEFIYTTPLGRIKGYPINVDKTYEGTIIIFPSNSHHTVYPFYTSNDYRISISGNLVAIASKELKNIFLYK